mmetsp:Transcript_37960/g.90166  ORF Transcript_37960/g.90166 Transcript_37960/m.90166 type:complete len:211 (+) Transcript_37960:744-1376(+)
MSASHRLSDCKSRLAWYALLEISSLPAGSSTTKTVAEAFSMAKLTRTFSSAFRASASSSGGSPSKETWIGIATLGFSSGSPTIDSPSTFFMASTKLPADESQSAIPLGFRIAESTSKARLSLKGNGGNGGNGRGSSIGMTSGAEIVGWGMPEKLAGMSGNTTLVSVTVHRISCERGKALSQAAPLCEQGRLGVETTGHGCDMGDGRTHGG